MNIQVSLTDETIVHWSLAHMVTMFSFWRNCQKFSYGCSVCFPSPMCRSYFLSTNRTIDGCYYPSFLLDILVNKQWCLSMPLSSVYLMIYDVDHLSCVYWPFVCLLCKQIYSNPLSIKKFGLFVIYYWVVSPLGFPESGKFVLHSYFL